MKKVLLLSLLVMCFIAVESFAKGGGGGGGRSGGFSSAGGRGFSSGGRSSSSSGKSYSGSVYRSTPYRGISSTPMIYRNSVPLYNPSPMNYWTMMYLMDHRKMDNKKVADNGWGEEKEEGIPTWIIITLCTFGGLLLLALILAIFEEELI